MLTVANLIKMAFELGLAVTFQFVPDDQYVSRYYNEETDTIVDCIPVQTDIGRASVCPMAKDWARVYVIKE